MPEWLQWLPEWLIPPPKWRGENSYIWWFILIIALIPSAVLAARAIPNLFRNLFRWGEGSSSFDPETDHYETLEWTWVPDWEDADDA